MRELELEPGEKFRMITLASKPAIFGEDFLFDFFVLCISPEKLLFFIPLYKPPHCQPLKKIITCCAAYGAWVF